MTEKRFKSCEVLDNVIYVDDTIISEKRLLEVLNENEQLKQELQSQSKQCTESIQFIKEENEKLKQENRHFQSRLFTVTSEVRERTLSEVKDCIKKLERYE